MIDKFKQMARACMMGEKYERTDTISPKRNIPLAGEGERDGVWGWIKGLLYEPNWACEQWLPCG